MPKISLVMPLYKTEEFLERAIDSILDQDYKDWELVVVADGSSKKAKKILKSYDDKRIRYLEVEHGGACWARNRGAELTSGEYISFFSSDFQAIPGMLRKWIMTLEEHKDCGFIYGGYQFPNKQTYPSEQFDARQLETYNYIDGGFPLKRDIWVKYPWDEKVKSLNDWDFWIRIVKAGYKGYFMPNYYSYIAEFPREGGLSHDSNSHWIERVKQVKANNDIPLRDICVTSLGCVYFARNMSKLLDADFMPMPSFKPHEYKMIYLVGFYPKNSKQHALVFSNSSNGCKKVVHWVGTDMYQLKQMSWQNMKMLRDALNQEMTAMFVESEERTKEMQDMGFKVETLPLLRDTTKFSRKSLPEEFAVAIYMPGSNSQNYSPNLMENVMKNMPDVKFYLYGDRRVTNRVIHSNFEIIGWKDIAEITDKCSMLLRFTIHDGLPTAPMEFVMCGRKVITNVDMPFMDKLELAEDVEGTRKEIIEKIRKAKVENAMAPKQASNYYRNLLKNDRIVKKIRELI